MKVRVGDHYYAADSFSEKKKATNGKDPCTEELKQKAEAEKAIAGLEKMLSKASRSTLVLLDNQTPHTLRLGNQHVESGSWPGSGQPPSRIRPNERVMFGSISKWVGDAEAHVSYQIEGSEADHISAAQS